MPLLQKALRLKVFCFATDYVGIVVARSIPILFRGGWNGRRVRYQPGRFPDTVTFDIIRIILDME